MTLIPPSVEWQLVVNDTYPVECGIIVCIEWHLSQLKHICALVGAKCHAWGYESTSDCVAIEFGWPRSIEPLRCYNACLLEGAKMNSVSLYTRSKFFQCQVIRWMWNGWWCIVCAEHNDARVCLIGGATHGSMPCIGRRLLSSPCQFDVTGQSINLLVVLHKPGWSCQQSYACLKD